MTPLFSIIHTSARPYAWRAVFEDWMSKCVDPSRVEYVICVDARWGFTSNDLNAARELGCVVAWNDQRRCYVDGVNIAAAASTGSILIVNADDQFAADRWDEALMPMLPGAVSGYGEQCAKKVPYVLEVSTGTPDEHERGIIGSCAILSRARYEQQGGFVFYPGYESMYADNDFCEWARRDGIIIDARHLMFPHRHGMFDGKGGWKSSPDWKAELDEPYLAQNRGEANLTGKTIFEWRKRVDFGRAIDQAATIEGWMFRDELECLSMWASQFQSIVEIGSWKGRSTYALCKGTAGQVTAVDTFLGTPGEPEHAERIAAAGGSTRVEFLTNTKDCANLSVCVSDSILAAANAECEMVFFDGNHTYEHLKAELQAWLPRCTKFLCGHDFAHPDVQRAVTEVLGNVEQGSGSLWYKALPSQRSIVLCYPGERFEGPVVDSLLMLVGHMTNRGFNVPLCRPSSTSNVFAARQKIWQEIMRAPQRPYAILFLDDDNPLSPAQFDMLLADLEAHSEVDGISGWCWIHREDKTGFMVSCGEWAPDYMKWRPFPASEFVHASQLRPFEVGGLPCLLMRPSALEKAGPSAFLPFIDPELEYGITGEDTPFFKRAGDGGAKFLVNPLVKLPHLKYVGVEPTFPEEGKVSVKVAGMIRARNEARWIGRTIESLKALCGDNIFVMEDGSTDDTVAVCEAAGAVVLASPFVGMGLEERRDKNWFLGEVKARCSPDWCIMIDGDEELQVGGCDLIRRELEKNPAVDVLSLGVLNLWDSIDQRRVDGSYGKMARQSLFRADMGLEFRSLYEGPGANPNHVGLHTSNAPGAGVAKCGYLPVFIYHYGPLHSSDRLLKYRWMLQIDPKNEAEDYYRHMVIGDLPEFPADSKFKHGGPLKLAKLPPRLVPKWDGEIPGPLVALGREVLV